MKLDFAYLHSRLARRVFWLFVACALVPISSLALVSMLSVSSELRKQSRRRLSQSSRDAGMMIAGRLNLMRSILETMARNSTLNQQGGGAASIADVDSYFDAVVSVSSDGRSKVISGEKFEPPLLFAEELNDLRTGEAVVKTGECGATKDCVFLAIMSASGASGTKRVVGRARQGVLWNQDEMPEAIALCVLDGHERAIDCDGASSRAIPEGVSGELDWQDKGRSFLGYYWRLPLKGKFGTDHWTIMVSEPTDAALSSVTGFRRAFPLIVLLAFWAVLLVSIIEIRRTLGPLEKLREGTGKVAEGDLSARVKVSSRDEFAELAESFNYMTSRIQTEVSCLKELHWGTLTALARAIDAKSPWTAGHSERVTAMAIQIGQALNMSAKSIDILHAGGLLHDVGKIGIPARLLDKPGPLTPDERLQVQEHVVIGERILKPIPGFEEYLPMVRQHHECFNGKGYPDGLAGERIPLHARVLAVADVFDALISDRPYRKGMPLEQIVSIIQSGSGQQFDPQVVAAFLRVLQRDNPLKKDSQEPALVQ